MASHQHELDLLSEHLDNQRNRQQVALREKLAENKRRRAQALRRKQEMELTKEMIEQKKELDEIVTKEVRFSLCLNEIYMLNLHFYFRRYFNYS